MARVVAEGPLPRRLPMRWQIGGAGLLVGRDRGFPVCDDYQPPFAFTGTHRAAGDRGAGAGTARRGAGDGRSAAPRVKFTTESTEEHSGVPSVS